MRFWKGENLIWVHQITWGFCALLCFGGLKNLMWFDGPWKSTRVHQTTWCFGSTKTHEILARSGSIKTHEVLRGKNFEIPYKGPSNHMRFWVHQNTWGFSRVVGPSKHMRFWEGKNLKSLVRVHQITWGFGSIKTHEVLTGEKIDFGPSNHMRFLGPSNQMRWWKMGKIWLGPSNHMSAPGIHMSYM